MHEQLILFDEQHIFPDPIMLAGIVPSSVVDGEGVRFVIFTQGCPHHCFGCHNPDTWYYPGAGALFSISDIQDRLKKEHELNPTLGFTISGGEPFLSLNACSKIARFVKEELRMNIWVYTGFTYEALLYDERNFSVLDYIDVLIDGPFIISERDDTNKFAGSKNQRIIDMNKSRIMQGVYSDEPSILQKV